MITIREITSEKDLTTFVKFPFKLYKNSPYWVPPIIKDEVASFSKSKNPVFEDADARFFLAYKNGKIAGRIVAIINWNEVNAQGIRKMRFGWMDMIDDVEVTARLIEKVADIGKENGMDFIEGPIGFNNLDKVGLLTKGYDQVGTMISWYNYPYYVDHLIRLGFKPEKFYDESYFDVPGVDISHNKRLSEVVQKRYKLIPLNFKKTEEILPYVTEMFEVFDKSYAKLDSYVPLSNKLKEFFKQRYIKMINPEYIKFVMNDKGRLVAFAITMPSYSKALQKARGYLFPFGFIHLLWARKFCKEVLFYLIGILPEYQKKGVTSIILYEFYKTYKEKNIKRAYRSAELENNKDIHLMWKAFNPVIHKKRSTYRKDLK